MTKTVDSFAVSYVMESMTDDIEEAVVELMQAVEDRGGAVAAIEEGFQKAEIEWSAYRVALEIDEGKRTIVGLNRYTSASITKTRSRFQDVAADEYADFTKEYGLHHERITLPTTFNTK